MAATIAAVVTAARGCFEESSGLHLDLHHQLWLGTHTCSVSLCVSTSSWRWGVSLQDTKSILPRSLGGWINLLLQGHRFVVVIVVSSSSLLLLWRLMLLPKCYLSPGFGVCECCQKSFWVFGQSKENMFLWGRKENGFLWRRKKR